MLLYLLVGVGLTQILTSGFIFEKIRSRIYDKFPNSLGYMVYCPMCMGFWVGLTLPLWCNNYTLNMIESGFVISAVSTAFATLVDYFTKEVKDADSI